MVHVTKDYEIKASTVRYLLKSTQALHQMALELAHECGLIDRSDKEEPELRYSFQHVLKIIKDYYPFDFTERTRKRQIVDARHVACFLLFNYTNLTLVQISNMTGISDHSSAIHAIRKVENLMGKDPNLTNDVENLKGIIESKLEIAA